MSKWDQSHEAKSNSTINGRKRGATQPPTESALKQIRPLLDGLYSEIGRPLESLDRGTVGSRIGGSNDELGDVFLI